MKPIQENGSKIIGYVNENGNKREIRGSDNSLLAWYDKKQDKTFTRDGHMAGTGDITGRFLK